MIEHKDFEKFRFLYLSGDFKVFCEKLDAIKANVPEDTYFLALKVYHSTGNTNELYKVLDYLENSTNEISRIRAFLLKAFLKFILENLTIERASQLLAKCGAILEKLPASALVFYVKALEININFALLSAGLLDATVKNKLIDKGIELFKSHSKLVAIEDAIDFLKQLINQQTTVPIPNNRKALNLLKCILHETMQEMDLKLYAPLLIQEIKLLLKTNYTFGIDNPNLLPKFCRTLNEKLKQANYLPAEAKLKCVYGDFLLDLEYIEGVKWLEQGVLKLWHLGHCQEAYDYQKKAQRWLLERSQSERLQVFNSKINFPLKNIKSSLEQEIELINEAHQYFSTGAYYGSEKLLNESFNKIKIASNKIHFLTLMVNSKSKLNIDNNALIRLIDSYINNFKHIKNSILLAQLYTFRALLENDFTGNSQSTVINLFQTLGIVNDEVLQRINRFHAKHSQSIKLDKVYINTKALEDLKECIDILSYNSWLPNRNTLKGKVFQAYGQALYEVNALDEAQKYFITASKNFKEANNLYEYAMNNYRIGSSVLQQARNNLDVRLYEKAFHIFLDSIKILNVTNLYGFLKSFQFMIALCYAEPLVYKIIPHVLIDVYTLKAHNYYMEALETNEIIITKNSLGSGSEVLKSIIALKKEMKQLISSGFQFYRATGQLKKSIYWLERTKVKSLNSLIGNRITPQAAIAENVLIKQEKTLIDDFLNASSVKLQTQLKNEIDDLYHKMLSNTTTSFYAKRKLLKIPDFSDIQSFLKRNENTLNGQKVFVLYYYVSKKNIFCIGISSELENPLIEKLTICPVKLAKDLRTLRLKLAAYNARKFDSLLWTSKNELIKPLEKWTKPEDIICIIPHAFLQNLPLHTLSIKDEVLISRNPVFYNLNLTSWNYLLSKPFTKALFDAPFIFGDPESNLPNAREEANHIASMLKTNAVIGKNVTKNEFKKCFTTASLLHFAGHGVYESATGFQSGIKFHENELLSVNEIVEAVTNIELIVLSSCNTALQKNYDGEELAGLATAFLSAGCKSILASLWPVNDEDARAYFTKFYEELIAGAPKVIAAQKATIALLRRPVKSHFYHWGMFTITGNWL